MYHLDLVVNPLYQKWMQSRRNTIIGMHPITTQNNTIVTLQLDDEECGSERLAPYNELHRDDASSLHRDDAPTPFSVKLVFTSSLSSLPNFLNME
jgi:hypothetical protein